MDIYKTTFESDGYVIIKNFFSTEEAENIVKYANELEEWDEKPYNWMIYFENNKKKSRIENFIQYHENLRDLLNKKIKPIVNKTYGKNMILFKDKLNWKYSNGKGFKPHQDHPAWVDFEPDRYISVAIFANKCTEENGCLEFGISGSRFTSICEYNKKGLGEILPEIEDSLKWVPATSTPRDILLFDSYVPHRSHGNRTDGSRRIFYFTFNEEKFGDLYDTYLKQKRKEFPPDIERTDDDSVKIEGNKYNLANPMV